MKGRVIKITIIFSLLLVAVTGLLALNSRKSDPQDERSQQLVDIKGIMIRQNRRPMNMPKAYAENRLKILSE